MVMHPLAGERKYCTLEDPWPLALWSCLLRSRHLRSGESLCFTLSPEQTEPWACFSDYLKSDNLKA